MTIRRECRKRHMAAEELKLFVSLVVMGGDDFIGRVRNEKRPQLQIQELTADIPLRLSYESLHPPNLPHMHRPFVVLMPELFDAVSVALQQLVRRITLDHLRADCARTLRSSIKG